MIRVATATIVSFLVAVFALSSVCLAQQISIRVVGTSDGRPLPGWKINVFFLNPTEGKDAVKGSQHFETDAGGMAQFMLPQPNPEVLDVYTFPQTESWYPGNVKAETAVVLHRGIQSKAVAKVRVDPGQILILAQRITLWDKIIHTIFGPLERE